MAAGRRRRWRGSVKDRIEGTPYVLLRHLTLPVVAVTSSIGGHGNGMIANGAQRASLVPTVPRVALYINKTNHTHDIVYRTGVFGLHLLRQDQWDLIWRLGLRSGREADKLNGLELRRGETGVPLLVDVLAGFDCRVVNAMDAGGATYFLGDVIGVHEGPPGPVMTSEHFREHMDDEHRRIYESLLAEAMDRIEPLARTVSRQVWPGATARP
jgi:flavin reductase (DIM6/NTAB) family NADH-FMN oxidoreductase RutF